MLNTEVVEKLYRKAFTRALPADWFLDSGGLYWLHSRKGLKNGKEEYQCLALLVPAEISLEPSWTVGLIFSTTNFELEKGLNLKQAMKKTEQIFIENLTKLFGEVIIGLPTVNCTETTH